MKRFVTITALTSLLAINTNAQKYLGVATGNWGGISSVYLNPANVADNRYRFTIELFGANAGVDNNLGKININKGLSQFLNGGTENVNDVFQFSNKRQFSLLAPYGEVRGPGFILSLGHKQSVAFSTRLRGMNQFNNFDQSLYRTITDSAYAANQNGDLTLTAQKFNWTAHVWGEASVTYGIVLLQKGHSELKVGATFRYLTGIGFLSLKGNNLDANYSSGRDSFYANNTDLEYASNIFSASSALRSNIGSNNFLNDYNSSSGVGYGGDIGIVYDYIADTVSDRYDMDGKYGVYDPSKNRYKLRFSAAINDFGAITYKKENNFGIDVRGQGYMTGKGFSDNVKNVEDFKRYALQQGFSADTFKRTTTIYMPTTLVAGVDYHVAKHYYVNGMFIGNLADRSKFGNSYYSQYTVTPRYETRHFLVSLPISYNTLPQAMKVGFALRAYGMYIGSDDALGLVTKRQYGLNVYLGASIPVGHRSMKDTDGDHVSDHRDRCPKEYGTWENRGCPEAEPKDSDDSEKKSDESGKKKGAEEKDTKEQ